MEIATTISSKSQMPQGLAGITPAEDAVGIQGKAAQSPSFGMLFDKRAGMAGPERLPVDSANKDITQLQFQGKSLSGPVTDGALRNDPAKGPLPSVTDLSTAGLFAFVLAAPDKTSQMPPKQAVTESGTSAPEKEENSAAASTPGENSAPAAPTMQMLSGLWPKIAKGGDSGESTKDFIGKLSSEGASKVLMPSGNPTGLVTPREMQGGISGGSTAAEKPREASEEEGGIDSVRTSLFAMGNLLSEADFATSLPTSAGPVQQQVITQPENNTDQSVMQPGDLLQVVAGGASGYLQGPVTLLPASGTPSQPSILKGAMLNHDTITEAKGDIQASRNILFSRTKGINSEAVDISRPVVDGISREAAAETPIQSRMSSEAAGNAYRAAATDAVPPGKNDLSFMPGSVTLEKPLPNQELFAASTGIDLSRIEIVFAAEERESLKEPGGAVTRKSGEGKTADNASAMVFVTNPAELRSPAESKIATASQDPKNPLGEHIASQIREKLEAGGHGADKGQITLRLHPEELGELRINMRMQDQHLKIEITTQNPSVKEALMQNLDTLKETLSRQNIAMDRFDVSADLRQGLHQGGRDGRQMTQENRIINTGFQHAAAIEEDLTSNLQYGWESENSLVNLVL